MGVKGSSCGMDVWDELIRTHFHRISHPCGCAAAGCESRRVSGAASGRYAATTTTAAEVFGCG